MPTFEWVNDYFPPILDMMPRACNAKGRNRNHRGEPYSRMVSLPDEKENPEEWDRWVSAMPSESKQLEDLNEIWV